MSDSWQDVREVSRALRRTPRFTLLCVAVLGVGIGLSAAMFSALNAVLLRRLPVADQDRVVASWGVNENRNFSHLPLTVREWGEFTERSRTLEDVAAVDYNGSWPWVMREGDQAYPVRRGLVSGGFFRTLGARPALGRLLEPGDDRVGAEPVAVVSEDFWRRQYGGDRAVVGRRLTMHATGVTYTIVGVAPQGLDYPTGTEMWVPIIPASTRARADTSVALVDVVGRLRRGATPRNVADELTAFFRQPERQLAMRQSRGVSMTLPQLIVGDVRRELTILGVAVGLLLFVACMNVAGLLMMRGTRRARDVALRLAVGASRGRIVRWHVTEGIILAALGCLVGVAVAYAALGGLRFYAPAQLPRLDQIRPDAAAMVAATVIALVTAVLFTAGPALLASRTDAATLLRAGAPSLSAGRRLRRTREGLVAAQVAAAVVVLSAAALVGRSLRELQRADLGFDKEHVMVVDLAWDFRRLTTTKRSLDIYDALLPKLRTIPGLVDASALILTPFAGTGGWDVIFVATDRSVEEQKNSPWLNTEVVSPSYFDVFRVPVRQGRVFTAADREGAPPVVVVSEGAARALWPDGRALGRQIRLAASSSAADTLSWTVVGVVADTRYRDYRRPRETIYFAHHRPPFELAVTMLAVRATGDPLALLPQIRTVLRETTSEVLVGQAATMEAHLETPLAQPRFNALLLATFAASALLIVGAGLYAVLAFSVRLRATELAIRSAIGASPRTLRGLVLRSAGVLVGGGVIAGLAVVALATRALRSMLYVVSPTDPLAITGGVIIVFVVAVVAMWGPTRSASSVSAAGLLRSE